MQYVRHNYLGRTFNYFREEALAMACYLSEECVFFYTTRVDVSFSLYALYDKSIFNLACKWNM
jgi:hypothetical protein